MAVSLLILTACQLVVTNAVEALPETREVEWYKKVAVAIESL